MEKKYQHQLLCVVWTILVFVITLVAKDDADKPMTAYFAILLLGDMVSLIMAFAHLVKWIKA